MAKQPFQAGYLNAVYDKGEAAAMGNGKAAMELMGQWAPSVQMSNSTSKKGIGDKLAWFPFPAVTGGKGAPTDAVGGGNGIAVGKDAPPDTFIDRAQAVVTGKLGDDGVFVAHEMTAKCASKYEKEAAAGVKRPTE